MKCYNNQIISCQTFDEMSSEIKLDHLLKMMRDDEMQKEKNNTVKN